MTLLRLFRRYLRPYGRPISVILFLLLIQAIANLYLPELNADIINNGVAKGDNAYILQTGGIMLVVSAVLAVCAIVAVYFSAGVGMAFGRDLRGAIFRSVQSFSQAELNRFGTPSLITRNTNDVQQIQTVVLLGFNVIILAPIMAVGGIIMALRQDIPLTGILIVILPLMALVIGFTLTRAVPLFRALQVRIDRINQVTRETLTGVRVIRAFVRTKHEEARFDAANVELTDTAIRVNRIFALMLPILMLIFNLSSVAILWFGAIRVDSQEMPIGNLVAFLQYVAQILMSVLMAVIVFVLVPRAAVSAERIDEVLATEPAVTDPATPTPMNAKGAGRTLEFRGVSYAYPGAEDPVLRDVSFTARPGQTTAIVGSTGSGKSTLVALIPRFADPTAGSVRIDGVDIRDVERPDLWEDIGLVPQKAFLFGGTVASNLRVGRPDATDDELWAALRVAQAEDFVRAMANGIDEPVSQGGTNLSGGQRQRLAIARALVKRPPIYVFDDSFSALDYRTDANLRAALATDVTGATVIIVAQRVGTILHADQIVVLDQGRVDGIGTHTELMASCETYREIVLSQLTEEEAA
jgi:ATP-binding cassette, subfamily B, multidrug efflux pump